MHYSSGQLMIRGEIKAKRISFAKTVLGPIFYDYCQRLHSHLLSYDDREATFLFCTRAGLRLKYLYELFLETQGLNKPVNSLHLFWISRFMTAKGLFLRCPEASFELIAKEFNHTTVEKMLPCLFPSHVINSIDVDISLEFDFSTLHSKTSPSTVRQVFSSDGEFGRYLRSHYSEQSELFALQIKSLLKSSSLGVLIDTGWNATTQRLLMEGYPEVDWHGLYFGRFGNKTSNNWHFFNAIGLMTESYEYDPRIPESCIHYHHHIIEDILEPSSPSVEYLQLDDNTSAVRPDPIWRTFDYKTPEASELHYQGIIKYFNAVNRRISLHQIRLNSQSAWKILHEKICFPTRQDVDVLDVRERSADFGKNEKSTVLIRQARESSERNADTRFSNSIWKQGQIALDFPLRAREMQTKLLMTYENQAAKSDKHSQRAESATVAIITRTKNRPVMLKRAGLSVASQTFDDFIWVVVNDGGDPEEVNQIVRQSPVDLRKTLIVHNEKSLGMEAASNKGIQSSQSKYIVIHDDDDSWQPQFLEKTVAFLENPPVESMRGVIAHANRLSEYIVDDSYVEILGSVPYQEWVMTVPLYEMASMNMFAPISFLFSRNAYDRVGGFDESLPVLGDWEFNIRFLMKYDIGVITEKLANYHHRDIQKSGSYSNSVYGAISKHQLFEAVVRNRGIRKMGNNEELTVTSLLGIGRATYDLRSMVQKVIESA